MNICIYCRRQQDGPYPAEHVIPRQFGTFHPNLTVHCVCEECNQFFGRTLEWDLGGDTAEGILKLDFGLRDGNVGLAPPKGVEITVRRRGPWFGAKALIRPNATGNGTEAVLLAQIGAQLPGSDEYVWFPEPQVNQQFADKYRGRGSQFVITGPAEQDRLRLRRKLSKLGIDFTESKELVAPFADGGRVPISIKYDFHDTISRCIAKIALNYLAYLEGAGFVLSEDFDHTRMFIRHGEATDMSKPGIVFVMKEPILLEERSGPRVTSGHLLAVTWDTAADAPVAQVSLFNTVKYRVVLCRRYHGVWRQIAKGHHFDLSTGTVSELTVTTSLWLAPGSVR